MFKKKADTNRIYNFVLDVLRLDPSLDPRRDRELRAQLADDYAQELAAKIDRENPRDNPNKTTQILENWRKEYLNTIQG